MFFHQYPITLGFCGGSDLISRWSPAYCWGGANPRQPISAKERARRDVRRKMAEASRRRNRR